jgi:hypothetical protein
MNEDTVLYLLFAGYDEPDGGAFDFRGAFLREELAVAEGRRLLAEDNDVWAHYLILNGPDAGDIVTVLPLLAS